MHPIYLLMWCFQKVKRSKRKGVSKMILERKIKNLKYTKAEDIVVNSFFYDEIGDCLYYITGDHNLIRFYPDGSIKVIYTSGENVGEQLENQIIDCSKLRQINDDDVNLTFKYEE